MGEIFSKLASVVLIAVAITTVFQMIKDRACFTRDDLREEDRSLAWRIVIFLIYPAIVALDLRSTIIAAEWFGGWVKHWSYGILWFEAIPRSLPEANLLVPVLFAGALVQFSLALSMLPAMFFRPHPFFATLLGYTITLIFAVNLLIDPVLSIFGGGNSRWQLAYSAVPRDELTTVVGLYTCAALIFIAVLKSKAVRLWFADLSRPLVAEELRSALYEAKSEPGGPYQCCRLSLLLEKAGLRTQALRELRRLRRMAPDSLYLSFAEPYLLYRRRRYESARIGFEQAADFPGVTEALKASFLAAAACSAFADGDTRRALNLCQMALEFDSQCLVARMVKVDAYLRNGNKEQAGEEVMAAIRQGMDFDVEDKIPLDCDAVLRAIARMERQRSEPALVEEAALP